LDLVKRLLRAVGAWERKTARKNDAATRGGVPALPAFLFDCDLFLYFRHGEVSLILVMQRRR